MKKEVKNTNKFTGIGYVYLIYAFIILLQIYLSLNNNSFLISVFLFILTIPFLVLRKDIIINAIKSLFQKKNYLEKYITFACLINIIYSFINIFKGKSCFEYTSIIIYIALLTKYLKDLTDTNEKKNINELKKNLPKNIKVNIDDNYLEIEPEKVTNGTIIVCYPMDEVLYDGVVIKKPSRVDTSRITGINTLQKIKEGDSVKKGYINREDIFEYRVESTKQDMLKEKENIIRNDKCYKDYLIVMFLLTIILFLVKIILNKNPFTSIIFLSLSVPILLPFIEYLPLLKSRMVLNKRGVLIKNINILEKIDSIDTIVLDKTRTITTGIPTINSINKHCDLDEREILEILVSIEKHSINNFSLGIKKYAEENFIKGNLDVITEELEGYGIKAKFNGDIYYACNNRLLKKLDIINSYKDEEEKLNSEGNDVIYLVKNNKVIALFGLKDTPRKESFRVIKKLKNKNFNLVLLTGDKQEEAEEIATKLDIKNILFNASKDEKEKFITNLLKDSKGVMMIGDGDNDAAAIKKSTIGVATRSATNNAISSADIILERENLNKIIDIIEIGNKVYKYKKINILINIVLSSIIGIIAIFLNQVNIALYIIFIINLVINFLIIRKID